MRRHGRMLLSGENMQHGMSRHRSCHRRPINTEGMGTAHQSTPCYYSLLHCCSTAELFQSYAINIYKINRAEMK